MPSDDVPSVSEAPMPTGRPLAIATGAAERSRRRKLALFALLLLVLALLAYTAYYFEANRRLPIPQIAPTTTGIEPPQYLYSITGTGVGALTKPIGLGVRDGRVYTVDFGTRSVKCYTVDGAFLFQFNKIVDGAETKLRNPTHLAIDPTGNVWVTDRRLQSVYVFSREGSFVKKFVPEGALSSEWAPFGITIDTNGDVYLTDVPGNEIQRVLVLDQNGKLKLKFGEGRLVADAKSAPGVFSFPNGLALSPGSGDARDLYVADSNNRRIQVFSPSGTFRRMIPTQGTPRGIAVDSQKRIYVADVLSHQVDIYSPEGVDLVSFGENGFGPGQFQYPEDLALDARGRIYISDRENNQIQVWGFRTAEIPGITRIAPGRWGWCLAPLPLLLIPLFLRRRRFLATADFVEGMIVAELVPKMVNRKWRWIVPEAMHSAFAGRVVDGVNLGHLLEPQPYSYSDATALADKLGIPLDRAGVLAMAKRTRVLCTEDPDLARLAVLLDIDVYDRTAFVQRFVERRR